jgi:glutathione S-transferase
MKKLFGHPDSGHAFKVRFFMCATNIDHSYEVVDIWQPRELRSAEFQAASKFGEVPLLLDGDIPYVQSNAILMHLARQLGQWGGETAKRTALCEQWMIWEANKIGMCLPQLRSYEKFDKNETLENALSWLKARYEHDVGVLESVLSDGRAWIIEGEGPSIADFSLCGYLYFADEAKLVVPPHVSAWLTRLSELDGWQHPYELMK